MILTGRRALVTGAGSDGMGRAIARALAGAGADVAVHYLNETEGARALVAEIEALGRRAVMLQADLGDPAAARGLVGGAVEALGGIDIAVSNAGMLLRKPFLELTDQDWARVQAVNLQAAFALGQEAAQRMVARNGGGRIVMVSSVNQWTANAGLAAYAASKGGLMQLAKSMALELAPHGITVNLIAPGTVETDFNRAGLADPAYRLAKTGLIPAGRFGTPEDVAAAALYLASDAAGYVTGTTITVDGGLTLS